MEVLDPVGAPGGREFGTQRPVWRVRGPDGRIRWAYVEQRGEGLWITGYPSQQVIQVTQPRQPAAGALVGASTGALIGAAFGGPPGAVLGGIIGAILLASGSDSGRR